MINKMLAVFALPIFSLVSASQAEAQIARPFLVTPDKALSAWFDGPQCSPTVRVTFKGRNVDVFKSSTNAAARMMNNVTVVLRQQCPALVRVTTKGVADGKIQYSGIAEAATNWKVVELGSGIGSGILAGGTTTGGRTSGPSARELFTRNTSFVPMQQFLEWARSAPTLCVRPDANFVSCTGLSEFSKTNEDNVLVTTHYKLDEEGSTAVLAYPATNKMGFFCTQPIDAKVQVKGGKMSKDGRADMESLLLERIKGAGNEICTGYQGKNAKDLVTASFDNDGNTQTQATAAVLLNTRPQLRLDK